MSNNNVYANVSDKENMKDKGNDADVVTDEQQSVLVDDEQNNSKGEDSE